MCWTATITFPLSIHHVSAIFPVFALPPTPSLICERYLPWPIGSLSWPRSALSWPRPVSLNSLSGYVCEIVTNSYEYSESVQRNIFHEHYKPCRTLLNHWIKLKSGWYAPIQYKSTLAHLFAFLLLLEAQKRNVHFSWKLKPFHNTSKSTNWVWYNPVGYIIDPCASFSLSGFALSQNKP